MLLSAVLFMNVVQSLYTDPVETFVQVEQDVILQQVGLLLFSVVYLHEGH